MTQYWNIFHDCVIEARNINQEVCDSKNCTIYPQSSYKKTKQISSFYNTKKFCLICILLFIQGGSSLIIFVLPDISSSFNSLF